MKLLIVITCLSVVLLEGTACGARKKQHGDTFDGFDDGLFEKTAENTDRDKELCERALYGASFDKWLRAYMSGNDVECDKQWLHVLNLAKGTTSLRPLFRSAGTRLQFLEGKEREKSLARGDLMFAYKKMLASTEKHLGKDNVLIATAHEYISNCYGDMTDWKTSALYETRRIKILEKHYGSQNPEIVPALRNLTVKLYKAKQYAECEKYAKRLVAFGTKYGDKSLTKEGTTYLVISQRKQKASQNPTVPLKPKTHN